MLVKFWGTVVQSEAIHLCAHVVWAVSSSFFSYSEEASLLVSGSLVSL